MSRKLPKLDGKRPGQTFTNILKYLADNDALPPDYIAWLNSHHSCMRQAQQSYDELREYTAELETMLTERTPASSKDRSESNRKWPLRRKHKPKPYGSQTMSTNVEYTREQPLQKYEYTCEVCGNECVALIIPTPMKPKYCLPENGEGESPCQYQARLQRQREYNAKKAKQRKSSR